MASLGAGATGDCSSNTALRGLKTGLAGARSSRITHISSTFQQKPEPSQSKSVQFQHFIQPSSDTALNVKQATAHSTCAFATTSHAGSAQASSLKVSDAPARAISSANNYAASQVSAMVGQKFVDDFTQKDLESAFQRASVPGTYFADQASISAVPSTSAANFNYNFGAAPPLAASLSGCVERKSNKLAWQEQFRVVEEMFERQSLRERSKNQLQHAESRVELQTNELVSRESEKLGTSSSENQATESQQDFGDFDAIWQSVLNLRADEAAEAQDQLNSLAEQAREWQEEFAKLQHDKSAPTQPISHYLGDYVFENRNPYLADSNAFDTGIELLESGASFSEIALAFEAAVQHNTESQAAWTQLGIVQSCNEKEVPAIRALTEAISLGEDDLSAVMALSVCYANEGFDLSSYSLLQKWISRKYPDLFEKMGVNDDDCMIDEQNSVNITEEHIRAKVLRTFIAAAQLCPKGSSMDIDVQVGLGIIFFNSQSFDKAVDCFRTALQQRNQDYILWNRFGAALANAGKSSEAIEAYRTALVFKPNFVRARYNLAVACVNLGCYKEATQHLLEALKLHQTSTDKNGGLNVSETLWNTLRNVILVGLRRPELAAKVVSGSDIESLLQQIQPRLES